MVLDDELLAEDVESAFVSLVPVLFALAASPDLAASVDEELLPERLSVR